jgi:DNA polymerase-3 subunit alpha
MMAFTTIEDLQGSFEVVVFPSVYASANDLLFEDSAVLIQGIVQQEEESAKMLADAIIPIDKAEETWTASIIIEIDSAKVQKDMLAKLKDILQKHLGACKVFFHMLTEDGSIVVIALPDSMKLKPSRALTREVNTLFGYDAVNTTCTQITAAQRPNSRFRGNNRRN